MIMQMNYLTSNMSVNMQRLINRLYDNLFKENRQSKEWNYEDELIKSKIAEMMITEIRAVKPF